MAGRRVAAAIGNGSGEAGGLQVAPTTAESKRIAGLVGPTLIASSASEALNYRIWDDNLAPVTYLDGALLFVGGLSIVRAHNRWRGGWPVLTTLAGWSALGLGWPGCSRPRPGCLGGTPPPMGCCWPCSPVAWC